MPFGKAVCPSLPHTSMEEAIGFKCMVSTKLQHHITGQQNFTHKVSFFTTYTKKLMFANLSLSTKTLA
jgi:hypothetical protein